MSERTDDQTFRYYDYDAAQKDNFSFGGHIYYTTNDAMTPLSQQGGTSQAAESAPKQSAPGTGENIVKGKINDPNSPEERLKRLERFEQDNHEKNKQLENRLKEVEPKPFYQPTPDGGGVIHLPNLAGGAIGAGIGAIGGVPYAIGGALLGGVLSEIPIHVYPEYPSEPYPRGPESGTD